MLSDLLTETKTKQVYTMYEQSIQYNDKTNKSV